MLCFLHLYDFIYGPSLTEILNMGVIRSLHDGSGPSSTGISRLFWTVDSFRTPQSWESTGSVGREWALLGERETLGKTVNFVNVVTVGSRPAVNDSMRSLRQAFKGVTDFDSTYSTLWALSYN